MNSLICSMLHSALVWCCVLTSLRALDMSTSSTALSIAICAYLTLCVSFTCVYSPLCLLVCVCVPLSVSLCVCVYPSLSVPPVIRSGSAHISPVVVAQQCPLLSWCLWSQQELQHNSGRDGGRCGVHRTCGHV